MKRGRWVLGAIGALGLLAALFFLVSRWSGLDRLVDQDQPGYAAGREVPLEPGRPVGQTFVARHGGLAGVEFFLLPGEDPPPAVTMRLRSDPQALEDLASATLHLSPGSPAGFYGFTFPPAPDSHGGYYYAELETAEPGVSVALAEGAAYRDGAAYLVHEPLDAQTAFRLAYAPEQVVLELVEAALGWMGTLAASGLLWAVPGWALLAWLWPGRRLIWAETLGLSVGLGLALYPLLFLWTDLLGLHLAAWYAWLPVAAGLVALIWRYRNWRPRQGWARLRRWTRSRSLWPDLALLLVLGLVFATRLLVVRTLAAPMWGDSYHHTMIAQLLVENGGLFDSWAPYVPLTSFTYHFGFHSAVAVYHWLVGANTLGSVLVVGQIVNGLAVASLYPLAVKVGRNRWAGVLAVLVAGLLSPMPMYYLNWGRYVQLAGQVILPVAVWLTVEILESPRRRLGLWLLTGLAIAGLFLTHYRVFIFYLLFLPVVWVASIYRAWRAKRPLRGPLLRLAGIGVLSLALALPWVWHLWAGYLPAILGEFATAEVSTTTVSVQDAALSDLTFYVPLPLLAAASMGIIAGFLKREVWVLPLLAWVALLFLAANPHWLGLPGMATVSNFAGVLNSFTVLMSLYMPVAILCGYLGGTLICMIPDSLPRIRAVVAVGAVLLLSLVGARNALTIADPSYILVTVPDLKAMRWIEDHTPEGARFLANSFFTYEDNVLVGSDAGWWIPLLAHRQNTVPPITYGHERAAEPDYIAQVNELGHLVQDSALDAPQTIQLLKSRGISHVYIGSMGGSLSAETLLVSEAYTPVYHEDRVWVFALP